MKVAAEPEKVVAVVGDSFHFNNTWLEEAAKKAAEKLGLGNRGESAPTFYFEDNFFVGKMGFSEQSDDEKKRILYVRELPKYSHDDRADLPDAVGNIACIEGDALSVFINELEKGPYKESFTAVHYEDPSVLHARSRFGFERRLVLKGSNLEEELKLRVGVDQEYLDRFVEHLADLGTPEAVHFAGEFVKREKKPLADDLASSELREYMNPHPRNADDAGYADRIADLAVHVINF